MVNKIKLFFNHFSSIFSFLKKDKISEETEIQAQPKVDLDKEQRKSLLNNDEDKI